MKNNLIKNKGRHRDESSLSFHYLGCDCFAVTARFIHFKNLSYAKQSQQRSTSLC